MATLGELILTDNYGQTYRINTPSAQIGSNPQCSVVLDEPGVREFHAEVVFDGNAWTLRRLSEEALLMVNDQQVPISQTLYHGDVITIGNAILRVGIPSSEPSPEYIENADKSIQHGYSEDLAIFRSEGIADIIAPPPEVVQPVTHKRCRACNQPIHPEAEICPHCGVRQTAPYPPVAPPTGGKSRVTAGVLGILLGGLGVHKFYLGQTILGIIYLVFFWTYIPAIVGFIEGISYLLMSDEAFAKKYK